jgi:hypothetical protein
MSQKQNLFLRGVSNRRLHDKRYVTKPTSFRARLSSGVSSGSLGTAGSFSFLLSASLPPLEDLAFGLVGFAESFVAGDWTPLPVLGVEVPVNLIFGFLTESDRWGV